MDASMEKEYGKQEKIRHRTSISANTKTIRSVAMANILGKMVLFIRENSKMTKGNAMENT